MDVGNNIKKERLKKGYTQKQLADQIYVTAQAVSRWEKGEIEPNLDILHKMSEIFNCKIDDLIYGSSELVCERCGKVIEREDPAHRAKKKNAQGEEEIMIVCDNCYQELLEKQKGKETVKEDNTSAPGVIVNKTVVVHQNDLHICAKCGKEIPEDDLVAEDITKQERHGRVSRTVSIGQTFYHEACLKEVKKEREAEATRKRKAAASKAKRNAFAFGITIGAIVLAFSLTIMLIAGPEVIHPGLAVLVSVILSYVGFATTYCLFTQSYISSVFGEVASWSIHFPGLIFEWSWDGFMWLIWMKLLFVVLGFLFGIFVILLALSLAALLSVFSFPFVLIYNTKNDYRNSREETKTL